jgi:hypothetical protein
VKLQKAKDVEKTGVLPLFLYYFQKIRALLKDSQKT